MARRRPRREELEPEDHDFEHSPPPKMRSRRRFARLWWGCVLLLLAGAAALLVAPLVAGLAPVRAAILGRIVPPEVGTVSTTGLSLGWFSSSTARGVVLSDPHGVKLLELPSVTVGRSLLQLAMSSRDLGVIRIERPVAFVTAGPQGSNLEQVIQAAAEAIAKRFPIGGVKPRYRLEIVDGRMLVGTPGANQGWVIEPIAATVEHTADGVQTIAGEGAIAPYAIDRSAVTGPAGRVRLAVTTPSPGQPSARVELTEFPLGSLVPWLLRSDPSLSLAGSATGSGTFDLQTGGPAGVPLAKRPLRTSGQVTLEGLAISSRQLSTGALMLPKVDLPWKLQSDGTTVTVQELRLVSDAGVLGAQGVAPIAWLQSPNAVPGWQGLRGVVEGQVDLARLATVSPGLLPWREGSRITQGALKLNASAEPDANGTRLLGELRTSPLTGETAGKAFNWPDEMVTIVEARRTGPLTLVEKVTVTSTFATLEARGDARQFRVNGRVDLSQLATRLVQLVDLRGVVLAGTASLNTTAQVSEQGQFIGGGSGELRDLRIAVGDREIAREPQLDWQGTAQGVVDPQSWRPKNLSAAQLTMNAAQDELLLELTEATPVAARLLETSWPVSIRGGGGVATWLPRLLLGKGLENWEFAGTTDVTARGRWTITPLAANFNESQIVLRGLEANHPRWAIAEPELRWTGDLAFDTATGTLTSRAGELVGSSLSARFKDWRWTGNSAQGGPAGGLLAIRTDLARLAGWQRPQAGDTTRTMAQGQVTGTVELSAVATEASGAVRDIVAKVDLRGDEVAIHRVPLVTGAASTSPIALPLRAVGGLRYAPATDVLSLDQLAIATQLIGVTMGGKIEQVSTAGRLDLAGTIDYNLLQFTKAFLAPMFGEGLQLAGDKQGKFVVRGTLVEPQIVPATSPPVRPTSSLPRLSRDLQARFDAPWDSANVYGLPIGAGRVAGEYRDGAIDFEPFDFALGDGGRLTAKVQLAVDPPPKVLTITPGVLLTDVRISPQISERMLKFIAPVVAGATQTDGQFSLRVDQAQFHLDDHSRSNVTGQLLVKSVRVMPGPAVSQWVNLGRELAAFFQTANSAAATRDPVTLVAVRDRTIDFRMVDGRVYHQGLEFSVGNVLVRSTGSVGIDETLNMQLDVPILDEWVEGRRLLAGLQGQSLRVEVRGTLRQPEVNRQALAELSQQLLRGGTEQLLNQEVGRALDRLLGR